MVRFKNRYVVVEINPLGVVGTNLHKFNVRELYKDILEGVQKLHGDFGVAAVSSGYTAKYCNEVTRIALIRTRHGPHRLLASALPCVTHVGQKPATLRTIFTGATLKRCFLFIQRYQRTALDKMWSLQRTEKERQTLEAAVMDLSVVENFHPKKQQNNDKNRKN